MVSNGHTCQTESVQTSDGNPSHNIPLTIFRRMVDWKTNVGSSTIMSIVLEQRCTQSYAFNKNVTIVISCWAIFLLANHPKNMCIITKTVTNGIVILTIWRHVHEAKTSYMPMKMDSFHLHVGWKLYVWKLETNASFDPCDMRRWMDSTNTLIGCATKSNERNDQHLSTRDTSSKSFIQQSRNSIKCRHFILIYNGY